MNYLALIGWSPGGDEELLPIDELARRFALEDVGLSAGVFDEEKLAWVNRHYLKVAAPARLAAESRALLPRRAADLRRRSDEALAFLASVMPMASGSVDRLEQVPARLRVPVRVRCRRGARAPDVRGDASPEAGARVVIGRWPRNCAAPPRLDREQFRAVANAVKQRTGQKGRRCSIRSASRSPGEAGGPELDLAVPAIDRGAELPASIWHCRRSSAAASARRRLRAPWRSRQRVQTRTALETDGLRSC